MGIGKKGYFFSMDAFIAFVIILGVVILIRPPVFTVSQDVSLQDDLLQVLSDLQIGQINNSYVSELISSGNITNLNNSVLEQIGEFYANSDPKAQLLAESILDQINLTKGLALYFSDNLLANTSDINWSNTETVRTSRQVISGIGGGLDASSGFSSRAFLYSKNKVKYFYFGGYVGDGNITMNIGKDVHTANIEADFGGDFDLYINSVKVGNYSPTPGIPYSIDLEPYMDKFSKWENNISFTSKDNVHIAGGYIKVTYNSTTTNSQTINFPGIVGFINLYDGLYVPGNLSSMQATIHYNSSYNIFMSLGNKKVYVGNSNGSDSTVVLNNTYLESLLDYNQIQKKTIPLRIGLENVSDISNFTVDSDVFSVTDLSGSMNPSCKGGGFWCCVFSGDWCGTSNTCNSCGGTYENKMQLAKDANKGFIDIVLNYSGNKVGLVGYETSVSQSDTHDLSNISSSLKTVVDSWSSGGSTCICCGINDAVDKIVNQTEGGKFLSMVVMSDGGANVQCAQQGTGDAKQDAIQAACDAYNNYGIETFSIGFGTDADQQTLQDIASCGNGNYYYGSIDEIVGIYKKIAKDILEAAYIEQTVVGQGITTTLYPDSKISLNYNSDTPYGIMITSETEEFGNNVTLGNFEVPNGTIPYDVKVVSYSGARWTDKVQVYNESSGNWISIFNLSSYNATYTELGDPYVINIPLENVFYGNNTIKLSTATALQNMSYGSSYDKVIYSLIKNISAYSSILPVALGCNWNVEFEDGTNDTLSIPSNYVGTDQCYFAEDNYFISGSNVVMENPNDAVNNAILNLFLSLDLNSNNKLETKFSEKDLGVSSVEVEGLPFTWETEVQARAWQ